MLSAPVCFVSRLTADLSNPARLTTDLRECSRDVLWSRKIGGIEIFAKGRYRQMSVDTQAGFGGPGAAAAKGARVVVGLRGGGAGFSGDARTRLRVSPGAPAAADPVLEQG